MRAFKSRKASCKLLSVLSQISCSLLSIPATPTTLIPVESNPSVPQPDPRLEPTVAELPASTRSKDGLDGLLRGEYMGDDGE